MKGNFSVYPCPNAVMISTLITKPAILLSQENITSSLPIFAAKMAPKHCGFQKIFFKVLVVIASSVDDILAQIVIFQLAVNHQSWIHPRIQNGPLSIGLYRFHLGCSQCNLQLRCCSHALIILLGSKSTNMIKHNRWREFFFWGNFSLFLHNLFWFCLLCVYIWPRIPIQLLVCT